MYDYNPEGFKEHIRRRTFSKRSVSETTNTSMPTVLGWINEGKDLYLSKLLKICNTYKVPLGDFIQENGLPVSSVFTDSQAQTEAIKKAAENESPNMVSVMKYEEQIKKMKSDYEAKISRLERGYMERIADIRESAAEKWTKKNAEALITEKKKLESKYESKLKEQNEEIIRLREDIAVLKYQLKNLRTSMHYSQIDMVSEPDIHNP